jgi:hypothetical protein
MGVMKEDESIGEGEVKLETDQSGNEAFHQTHMKQYVLTTNGGGRGSSPHPVLVGFVCHFFRSAFLFLLLFFGLLAYSLV